MNNDRELIHAALQWHAAHTRRMAIGAEKRQHEKALKAIGDNYDWNTRLPHSDAAARLTPARHKELAAVRKLAKACAAQRGQFDEADIIDQDGAVTLLAGAD